MKPKSILIGAASALAIAGAAQAGTVTVVSWGGAYTTSQIEAYHKPWMAKTGNQIISEDYNGGLAEVKAQVEAGNVTWDIVDVELSDAVRGCDEGLFEKLDYSKIAPKSDFMPAAVSDCGVGIFVWSTVMAYNGDKLNANSFFNNKAGTARPTLRRHQFGGSAGGAGCALNTGLFTHQSMPISFALSIEQMTSRSWIVSSSMSSSFTFTSPAMTTPLSSTRSSRSATVVLPVLCAGPRWVLMGRDSS